MLPSTQHRQKCSYDIKHFQNRFNCGDLVYKQDDSTKVGQSKKLRPIWVGPYIVERVLSSALYCVISRKGKLVLHHDKLKLCEDGIIPLWVRRKGQQVLDLDETIAYDEAEQDPEVEVPKRQGLQPNRTTQPEGQTNQPQDAAIQTPHLIGEAEDRTVADQLTACSDRGKANETRVQNPNTDLDEYIGYSEEEEESNEYEIMNPSPTIEWNKE